VNIIERYTNPSKHVQAPYSTICKNGEEFFIQVSKDAENPNWLTMGDFLVKCFQTSIQKEDFIKNCLETYDIINSITTATKDYDIEEEKI